MSKLCFLPFRGEFGWYIMTYVRRFHELKHPYKIACIKSGHECLFPTATEFFYDWEDIPDQNKCMVNELNTEPIKHKLKSLYGNNIQFVEAKRDPLEKAAYAHCKLRPKPLKSHLSSKIVIAPRNRNWLREKNKRLEFWQKIVDAFPKQVSVIGAKDSTYKLKNTKYNSYDYIDVDSDVSLIENSEVIICQDSGLLYLALLFDKPIICVENLHVCSDKMGHHQGKVLAKMFEAHRTTPLIEAKAMTWSQVIQQVRKICP